MQEIETREGSTFLKPKFTGQGVDFFVLILKNVILTALTLGIYAAWAKIDVFKFFYSNTEFEGERFRFTGTGVELFLGYLKVIAFFIVVAIFFYIVQLSLGPEAFLIAFYLFYFLVFYLMGFAFYASRKFRFSRSLYREIRFRLKGNPFDFAKDFFINFLITIFTFGILGGHLSHCVAKNMFNNLMYGSAEFSYEGKLNQLAKTYAIGYLLTIVTLGIYSFWWQIDVYKYIISHIKFQGKSINTTVNGGDFFILVLTNILIAIFTLGLGFAWIQMRVVRFFVHQMEIEGPIDFEKIKQTTQDQIDAGGEGLSDAYDIDLGIGL